MKSDEYFNAELDPFSHSYINFVKEFQKERSNDISNVGKYYFEGRMDTTELIRLDRYGIDLKCFSHKYAKNGITFRVLFQK